MPRPVAAVCLPSRRGNRKIVQLVIYIYVYKYNSGAVFIGRKPADALRPAMRLHGRKSFHYPFCPPPHLHHDRRIRLMRPSAEAASVRSSSNLETTENGKGGVVVLVAKVSFPPPKPPTGV